MLKGIIAFNDDLGIGIDDRLPWRLPEDLKHFKRQTLNQALIVGRVTYEALPPLKNRTMHVLSRSKNVQLREGDVLHRSLATLPEDAWVIGGAKVYELLLPYCSELLVTHVEGTHECDTYFSGIPEQFEAAEELMETESFQIIQYGNKQPIQIPRR